MILNCPFLIRDKGYNQSIVADVISNYRSSFEFAKLDKIEPGTVNELPVKRPQAVGT